MLSLKEKNKITFKAHRGVVPPTPAKEGEELVEKRIVCSGNMKLTSYGYTMTRELFEACLATTHEQFMDFFSMLFDIVSDSGKAISMTKPIWPNFPNDAMSASVVELYLANFIDYITHGQWNIAFDPKLVCPELDKSTIPALKQIPACNEDEFYSYVIQCITSKTPLSQDNFKTIFNVVLCDEDEVENIMTLMKDKHIYIKENLAAYVVAVYPYESVAKTTCIENGVTSTDVLRIAAAMSNSDVSLATAPKFRSFTRAERRFLLYVMENSNKTAFNDGFAQYPEYFKRFGEKVHPREYAKVFPKTAEMFAKVRNGEHITTFNSILQELMKQPVDITLLVNHLMTRPGMYARYLDFALRSCKTDKDTELVMHSFVSVCNKVSPRVLVQLINHFRNRNNPIQLATGKANGAATKAMNREVAEIPADICKRISTDISNELWQILRKDDEKNLSVYIDPSCHCNMLVFPDNTRQISSALRTTACGSRTPLPTGDVIRAFLYWKEKDCDDEWDGIDLDLSVLFFNEKKNEYCSYFNTKVPAIDAIHSGDKRSSGKNGAVEYIDFNVPKCLKAGFRYVAVVVNSYSGENFSEMEKAFCGVMVRDGKTGEQFEPSTVKDQFSLTTDTKQLCAVVIDLAAKEVVTVDKSINSKLIGCNVASEQDLVKNVCYFAMQQKSLSIKEMLGKRFASFLNDNEWKKADVIVSDEPNKFILDDEDATQIRVVNPYDVNGITALIFGENDSVS